jgi:PAS domain S-box-containing protein
MLLQAHRSDVYAPIRQRTPLPERVRTIVRASNIALTVVDIEAPGQPLVVANEAFLKLTGYTNEEVIGRNCRFLQNNSKDQTAAEDIRTAIDLGVSAQVKLVNFTKDGTRFVNLIYLYPLESADGVTRHYLGAHFAETGRGTRPKTLSPDVQSLLAYSDIVKAQSYRTISETVATVLRASLLSATNGHRALAPPQILA